MTGKTLESVQPGETFEINGSPTRYFIIYKILKRVFCVIIGGHSKSIGNTIIFQENKTVANTAKASASILLHLTEEDKLIIENPDESCNFIYLQIVKTYKGRLWLCEEILPKKGKERKVKIFTPAIKVG